MALRLLKRAASAAAKKAAAKAKSKKLQEAAKKAAAKAKAAAKSQKAAQARVKSQNAVAKAKKTAELRKANPPATKAQLDKLKATKASRNASGVKSQDSKIGTSAAAKAREKASVGSTKTKSKAPAKLTTKSKPNSTVKSPLSRSKTLQRRANRRSVTPTKASKSKQNALVKRAEAKSKALDTKGSDIEIITRTLAKSPSNKGVANQRDSRGRLTKEALAARRQASRKTLKTTESKGKSLTKAQKRRQTIVKLQDRGAKQVTKRTPKNSADAAQAARGNAYSADRYGREPIGRRKSKRAEQQQKIQDRRRAQKEKEGTAVRRGRVQRLSAADARAAADKYEIDKMKEITKTARTMQGRAASDYMKKAKKEMKREAASIRQNARSVSLSSQTSAKNNPSPSSAYQDPKKMGTSIRLRNAQTKGERFSVDLSRRKAEGKLKPITHKKGTASGTPKKADSSTLKKAATPKQQKARTITNKSGQKEARISPRTQPNKRRVTARKDNVYEPKGIDPKRSAQASSNVSDVNKAGTKLQGPKQTPTRAFNTTGPAKPKAQGPRKDRGLKAQTAKTQRANEALRRRNEPARQASRKRAADRVLNRMRSRSSNQSYESFGQGTNRLGN